METQAGQATQASSLPQLSQSSGVSFPFDVLAGGFLATGLAPLLGLERVMPCSFLLLAPVEQGGAGRRTGEWYSCRLGYYPARTLIRIQGSDFTQACQDVHRSSGEPVQPPACGHGIWLV